MNRTPHRLELTLDEIRLMRWKPVLHSTNGEHDLWKLVDNDNGETIVSLGVPHGRNDIVGYVAACCSSPVRWVTSLWKRDPAKTGVGGKAADLVEKTTRGYQEAMFSAVMRYHAENSIDQVEGYSMNEALAAMWFAFCGQLPHAERGWLLFEFLQLATTDYQVPESPSDERSPLRPERLDEQS